MQWQYIKDKGIQSSDGKVCIFFNTSKSEIDNILSSNSITKDGRVENEFCYSNIFNTCFNIRLSFVDNRLKEIEVLEGSVIIAGVKTQIDSDIRLTLWKLRLRGHRYIKHTYGYLFTDLKIDLGDSYENGGDRRQVYWIYTAENIDHIIDQ